MKKNTQYFSHDYNSRNDEKMLLLRFQLGMEGFGIYWYLVESLAEAGGLLSLSTVPMLAEQMKATEIKVMGVIKQYGLFEIAEEKFFSLRLNRHLEERQRISDGGSKGAKIRWNRQLNAPPISPPNAPPYAKERKGKEIKVKEKKEIQIPTESDFLDFCKEVLKDKYQPYEFALKAKYEAWASAGWRDGNGEKIKIWKTKIKNTIPYLKPMYEQKDSTASLRAKFE